VLLLSIFPRVLSRHRPPIPPAGGASNTESVSSWTFHGTDDAERNSSMKTLAFGVLLSLALGAQGFAIIRSPYPTRTRPPYQGQFIVVSDDAKSQTTVKSPK